MNNFTPLDWFIAGAILAVGFIGSAYKVFYIDDPEIKQYHDQKKHNLKHHSKTTPK